MDILIGNLPSDAPLVALHTLLGNVGLRPAFQRPRRRDGHHRTFHCLIAHTASRADGKRLIAGIDGRVFHGHVLVAQEHIGRKIRIARRREKPSMDRESDGY